MKHIFFTLILLTLSLVSFSQGEGIKHSITIEKFETKTFNQFNPIGVKTDNILKDIVENGFYLAIKDNIKIDSFEVLNEDGSYPNWPADSPSKLTGYITYTLSEQFTTKDNQILIRINQGGKEALITLNVDTSSKGGQGDENNKPCKDLIITDNKSSDCNTDEEYFGELADLYNDKTVVYVYDFNKDPSKRIFYKITKNKETGLLKREFVNLNKETLTTGKNVKFKIYNINKFMYNVSIADSLVQFESEPPTLFNEFFLGDKDGLLGSLIEKDTNNVKELSVIEDNAKTLLEKMDCFIKNYNTLRSLALIDAYNPCNTFHCCQKIDYDAFVTTLSQIKSQKKNVEDKLIKEKSSLQKMVSGKEPCFNLLRLKTSIDINIKNSDFTISKFDLIIEELTLQDASLKNQIDKIQKEIKSIESQIFFSSGADNLTKNAQLSRLEKEQTEKKVEFTANRNKLIEQQTKRLELDIERNKLMNSYDSVNIEIALACDTSIQNEMKNIEDMIYSLEIANYLLDNLPNENELTKLVIFVNNMVAQNYIHSKDYISLNGNMLDLTLSISSKDSSIVKKLTGVNVDEQIPIQIPIIWKPFVSFSTGTFIAVGSNMQNKTYAWQEIIGNNNTANTDNFTLVESGFTLQPMGFSALGNLQWKVSRSFGFGGSVGVGLTIEKTPRLAYLGGVSLFFGDLRQLVITGGFAGMQVNKLTNNYQSITDNQIIYTSKPDIQYYNEFKVGGFISLTYTPFKIYKTKTVKSKNK